MDIGLDRNDTLILLEFSLLDAEPKNSWRDASAARCLRAVSDATATCDRLALVRTLVWLRGGRINLSVEGIELSDMEINSLARFGLKYLKENQSVRIIPDDMSPWWFEDLHIDPRDRRGLRPGTPDAVLLKFTENEKYMSIAQKAAVRAMLTQPPGSGLLASMPTGAGKSLVFQMAALFGRSFEAGSCVVVITPTIALALDHERTLKNTPGLENSRALISDLSSSERQDVLNAFRRGEIPVLLMGPETALSGQIQEILEEATKPTSVEFGLDARLTHFIVDEAHIVESWGRSFRPDFQRLSGLLRLLRRANPETKLILLSATLTPASRNVLRSDWKLEGDWLEVDAKVPRYEHDVAIGRFGTRVERDAAFEWVIDRVPRPAIVYTSEINTAKKFFSELRQRGYERVALFTGETKSEERRSIVNAWAEDELDLILATSAFGMGVDKANVRSVIHLCVPESPSRWYQEIGRASRDGGQGVAVMLFVSKPQGDDDVRRAFDLATSGWLTRELAESRWSAMADTSQRKWIDGKLQLEVDLDAIRVGLGQRSSDLNRVWNRTLLTLMQRAEVIRVLSVTAVEVDDKQIWVIEVVDNKLMSQPEAAWNRVFYLRERELTEAKAFLTPFVQVVERPEKDCVTQLAFELIEPSSWAPPCGRCPYCRRNGIVAPKILNCGGLEVAWSDLIEFSTPLPSGPIIVEPSQPSLAAYLPTLVNRLAEAGIEQFLVPDKQAENAALALSSSRAELGFVMAYTDWNKTAKLAELPTALILPSKAEDVGGLVSRFVSWASDKPMPTIVVGEAHRISAGRRLDQWVSRYAPVLETQLPQSDRRQKENMK